MAVSEADELYGLSPAEFTAARDALVKRLRADGRREDAEVVAKRRRPPATAWALDQVARHQPALIDDVLAAGARLRRAMERTAGGDASGLRDAQAAERAAIDAAIDAAAGHLRDGGHPASPVQRSRMAATLRAAVLDDGVAAELRAGTLERDHDQPGFGLEAAVTATAAGGAARRDRPDPAAVRQAARQRATRQAEVDKLTRRAHQLAAVAEDAEGRAAEARARADQAAADADAARTALELSP